MKRYIQAILLTSAGLMLLVGQVNAQYYDLSVGTERHFSCWWSCPATSYVDVASESVIDEIEVDGQMYAVIVWTEWRGYPEYAVNIEHGMHPITATTDTTYYRMDGSLLIENVDGTENVIFDYGFAKGDSVLNTLSEFLTHEQLNQNYYNYPGIASKILVDTLLHFPDGISRNILWGDDTLQSGSTVYVPPEKLDFQYTNNLPFPFQDYSPIRPFYYISGMGTILTHFNHRQRTMCGYRKPDGYHFGCEVSTITSIENDDLATLPSKHVLHQSYPNPFNPITQIRFELPMESQVEIGVYTVTGRLITTLVNEVRPAGMHNVSFDASDLASGVYIYRIRAGDFTQTRKMTLVK